MSNPATILDLLNLAAHGPNAVAGLARAGSESWTAYRSLPFLGQFAIAFVIINIAILFGFVIWERLRNLYAYRKIRFSDLSGSISKIRQEGREADRRRWEAYKNRTHFYVSDWYFVMGGFLFGLAGLTILYGILVERLDIHAAPVMLIAFLLSYLLLRNQYGEYRLCIGRRNKMNKDRAIEVRKTNTEFEKE